jgi:hypothetical protein
MIFTAFPGFFLDIIEETYNIGPLVALHEKKFPFRAVCFVIRAFWLSHMEKEREVLSGELIKLVLK